MRWVGRGKPLYAAQGNLLVCDELGETLDSSQRISLSKFGGSFSRENCHGNA